MDARHPAALIELLLQNITVVGGSANFPGEPTPRRFRDAPGSRVSHRAAPWLSFAASAALHAACHAAPGAACCVGPARVPASAQARRAAGRTACGCSDPSFASWVANVYVCAWHTPVAAAGLRERLAAEVRDARDNADLKAAVRPLCLAWRDRACCDDAYLYRGYRR